MANPQLLEKHWIDSGKKKTFLSEKMNISRPRLNYIFAHPDSATVSQADMLSKELSISLSDKKIIFYP